MHEGQTLVVEQVEGFKRSVLRVLHAQSLQGGSVDLRAEVFEQQPPAFAAGAPTVGGIGPSVVGGSGGRGDAVAAQSGRGSAHRALPPQILSHGRQVGGRRSGGRPVVAPGVLGVLGVLAERPRQAQLGVPGAGRRDGGQAGGRPGLGQRVQVDGGHGHGPGGQIGVLVGVLHAGALPGLAGLKLRNAERVDGAVGVGLFGFGPAAERGGGGAPGVVLVVLGAATRSLGEVRRELADPLVESGAVGGLGVVVVGREDAQHVGDASAGAAAGRGRRIEQRLGLQVIGLLGGDLVLQVLDLLLGFGDVDGQHAHVSGAQRLLVLHRVLIVLQTLDLLQQLVQQHQGLRGQRLVEDLRVEVARLNGHLDLLNQQLQLLSRGLVVSRRRRVWRHLETIVRRRGERNLAGELTAAVRVAATTAAGVAGEQGVAAAAAADGRVVAVERQAAVRRQKLDGVFEVEIGASKGRFGVGLVQAHITKNPEGFGPPDHVRSQALLRLDAPVAAATAAAVFPAGAAARHAARAAVVGPAAFTPAQRLLAAAGVAPSHGTAAATRRTAAHGRRLIGSVTPWTVSGSGAPNVFVGRMHPLAHAGRVAARRRSGQRPWSWHVFPIGDACKKNNYFVFRLLFPKK